MSLSTAQVEATYTAVVDNPSARHAVRINKPADAESPEGLRIKSIVVRLGPMANEAYMMLVVFGSKDTVKRGEIIVACGEEFLRLEGIAPSFNRNSIAAFWLSRYLATFRKYVQVRFFPTNGLVGSPYGCPHLGSRPPRR